MIRLSIRVDDATARLLADGDAEAWQAVAEFIHKNVSGDAETHVTVPAVHAIIR